MASGFAENRSWIKSRYIDALFVDCGDEQPQGRYIDARRTNFSQATTSQATTSGWNGE